MNSTVVRKRIAEVVRPDSITYSQGDFLATHVPLKRLHLLNSFQMVPTNEDNYTEEDVYRNYVLNPDNKHQLIAVYGQSGTGKSHLIRWFEARFEQDKPDNEVVLFVKRSDNTLKGTIKQLLEKEEVKNIPSREIYERLLKATSSMEEQKLKDMLYSNFAVEVRNDHEDHEGKPKGSIKSKLSPFLENGIVRDHMLREDGPVERIYSKIAEQKTFDRDIVAEFRPIDFEVSNDLFESLNATADANAVKLARKLMADETGKELAESLSAYLNQFVSTVIQRCAGIESGDFRQVFLDIRKELFRQGKGLTLFIEDVTSFTGVNEALLDALIVEHTGLHEEEGLCRISSIIGTTNNYLQNNFRDNHKDRITKFVYIPSDVFDEQGLYEFVGRYINTMSLESVVIDGWLSKHADPVDYPVHKLKEGKSWDSIGIEYNKTLNLYPFTKNSITYFYQHRLEAGHQTPRYIIKDIIEPVVRDIIDNKTSFPDEKYRVQLYDTDLNHMIHSSVEDQSQAERLFRFLSIWGDGTHEEYTNEEGIRYICSINEDVIKELGFPSISLVNSNPPPSGKQKEDKPPKESKPPKEVIEPSVIPTQKTDKIASLNLFLSNWLNDKAIDISSTVKDSALTKNALRDLAVYITTAINWQAEGVSLDTVEKVNIKGNRMFYLEGQSKSEESLFVFTLPASWESLQLILAFAKWREYGGQSWNYSGSVLDAYFVSNWTEKNKSAIIDAVREKTEINGLSYIDAAVVTEIIRKLLCGDFSPSNLKRTTIETVTADGSSLSDHNEHSGEWKTLAKMISSDTANTHKTVQDYFNIVQGDVGGSIKVYDTLSFDQTIQKAIKNNLHYDLSAAIEQESIKNRRDIFDSLKEVYERLDSVVRTEKEKANTSLKIIVAEFGDDDIEDEDVLNLINVAQSFYDTINDVHINIGMPDLNTVKQNAKQIATAINRINKAVEENDTVALLVAFSKDPLLTIRPLLTLLEVLRNDIQKADNKVAERMAQVEESPVVVEKTFLEAVQELDQDIVCLKEV